ncbi:MAG: right-handed parallel beta-helix repeat-containing protein [Eubacteriales bacterium]|nr:right-handed parallel beta-helix repeat-containing protein [Eubacteriales bacterium]
MKRKILSFLILLSVIPFTLLSAGFSKQTVTVKNESGEILLSLYSADNITSSLKKAFDYTSKNADENNLLTIFIEKGSYEVRQTVHLTSYTTVDLGGARLINSNKKRGNIFKSPEDKPYPKYSSLAECVIKNGTLDGNYNKNQSCMLRLCHAENVLIENVTFLNNYYSHHAELAASKNVTFRNCTFSGQVSDLNISSSEAIQIDILDKAHFYGFTCYDNTMNDNITIENCTFKNVFRGVGTHNYFKNLYHTNITVTGCTFENITDCAISAVNFEKVVFKNNNYINCKYSVFSRTNGK